MERNWAKGGGGRFTSLSSFQGRRLELENLGPTMVPWSGDGLARKCDSLTSTSSNFLGRCGRKLELEIEVLCSLPFLQTPDDLEIQTMLLTFPGATEATQNWAKGTVKFACRKSYVPLLPSILPVCPGSRLLVF